MSVPAELAALAGTAVLLFGVVVAVLWRQRTAAQLVARDLAEHRDALLEAAARDATTGLSSREEFLRVADQRLRSGGNVAVLVIEVDGLERAHASYGHAVGDAAAVEVARRIRAQLGSLDIGGRLGTERFVGLLRGVRSRLQAEETARRIADQLREPIDAGEIRLSLPVAVGVALSEADHDQRGRDLLRNASIAARRGGLASGSTVAVFDTRDRELVQERHRLERDLRHAIERGELELHLQPLVSAGSLTPRGFEALVRWRHPERGLVSPAKFVPIAEETGAIIDLGTWVLEEGCRILRRLHDRAGSTDPYVSLNVSGRQLMDPRLPMTVASALGASGAPASRLLLEVTETVMMDDIHTGLIALDDLSGMGVGVALDDFGTGHSSLAYLSRMPATHLKVDRSFVQRVNAGTADRRIVGAVIALARGLGLRVVAEGVETEQEASILHELGSDMLQGYWIARPMPAAEAIEWFVEHQDTGLVRAADGTMTIHLPDAARRRV